MANERKIIAEIQSPDEVNFEYHVQVLIVGAGACGLTAALAANDNTNDILVLERDSILGGSTALSSGFVPAAQTKSQVSLGINDSAEIFSKDISNKAGKKQNKSLTSVVSVKCGEVLDWLGEKHGIEWQILDNFLYPGHSVHRMHAVPEKTGVGLINRLQTAVTDADIAVSTNSLVDTIFMSDDIVKGVRVQRPNNKHEFISCDNLILACNGYGANNELVRKHIPEMCDALYFGHAGNEGHAVLWGEQINANIIHLSGYQGHGSVATPHGILITWALMMEGGIQVNEQGMRFSNENQGYSEQSMHVLEQSNSIAWNVYDEKVHLLGKEFPDYQKAINSGAIKSAENATALAKLIGIDQKGFEKTLSLIEDFAMRKKVDKFGRQFMRNIAHNEKMFAIKVTGALFHTQGGLSVNDKAQVLKIDDTPFDNLFAGGGAACGVSGPDVSGYLSGNGLLTAFSLGGLAGWNASK